MIEHPNIAIIYLSFNSERHLPDVLSSLRHLQYPKEHVTFVIVDNPHPEHGSSMRAIEEIILPYSGKEIPKVVVLPQKENLGFAGGNNVGIAWAVDHGCDYIFLHNDDGFLAANALQPLVDAMQKDTTIGAAQSLVLLHPETALVNTTGNAFQYLGYGYCGEYRYAVKDLHLPAVKDIAYASGAAVMLRADLIRKYGDWDHDFFMYHEDLEYSMRLRMAGYRVVLVRDSMFYHKYQFSRSIQKFYWMERNRYGVLLMFYRWPTLLLLIPMLAILEIGLWLFAWRGGWWKERVRVWQYWLNREHIRLWLGKRKNIQAIRVISDAALLRLALPGIYFQEKKMETPLLIYVGNPLMTAYYYLLRVIVRW